MIYSIYQVGSNFSSMQKAVKVKVKNVHRTGQKENRIWFSTVFLLESFICTEKFVKNKNV